MEEGQRKEIEEIIKHFKCTRDFGCCKSGFQILCKAQDTGLETFLECLEESPWDCQFSLAFGDIYLCECPLRVYVSKKLKK